MTDKPFATQLAEPTVSEAASALLRFIEWHGHKAGCMISDPDPRENRCTCGWHEVADELRAAIVRERNRG